MYRPPLDSISRISRTPRKFTPSSRTRKQMRFSNNRSFSEYNLMFASVLAGSSSPSLSMALRV